MKIVRAFLVRDFRVAWSYKFSFFTQFIGIIVSMFTLRLISDVFQGSTSEALEPYGGDYFGFALVGSAISLLSYPAVKSFAGAVRGSQVNGTLEAMLTTRARPTSIILGGGAYSLLWSCLQLVAIFAVGTLLFGANVNPAGLALGAVVLLMTVATLMGVGLMSAAFVLAFKQTEPFSGMLLGGSILLSGTIYPTSVLPTWLEFLSPLVPLTHSIELARQLLLEGATEESMWWHWTALGVFCLALPVGLLLLNRSFEYARRAGSLSQY
jgi:ABC-2 type transport system permease protein